jgi:hypothetical protein
MIQHGALPPVHGRSEWDVLCLHASSTSEIDTSKHWIRLGVRAAHFRVDCHSICS